MPFLKLEDIDLYYEIQGEGEPLFLVPGLCGTCDSFSLIIRNLSKKFKVVTLDNRGAGRSIPQNDIFTIENMADDLSKLVNHLDLGTFNLLGHSMGGFIAQEYVSKNSSKVKNLILSNTAQKTSYRNKDLFDCLVKLRSNEDLIECWHRVFSQWIFTETFINNNPQDYESAISYSVNYIYHQQSQHFESQVKACKVFDSSKSVIPINNRTLIICGGQDILICPKESLQLQNSFPCSKFKLMENAGHVPMFENKEDYCKIITEFLSVS